MGVAHTAIVLMAVGLAVVFSLMVAGAGFAVARREGARCLTALPRQARRSRHPCVQSSLGDDRDALFWKRQVTSLVCSAPGPSFELDPEEFLEGLERITGYTTRHDTNRAAPTGGMEADFGTG